MKTINYNLKMKQAINKVLTNSFCLLLLFVSLHFSQAQQIFIFSSDATNIPIPDNGYNGNISSMALKELQISGIPDNMNYITSSCDLIIHHTWAGDLTIKLFDEAGYPLGLMSRPGLVETADDGTECCGTGVNIEDILTFKDQAPLFSEDIGDLGSPVPAGATVVPSRGAINSPYVRFSDFFGGMNSTAINGTTWHLGVGDSSGGDLGEFISASLIFQYDYYCVPKLTNSSEYITNVTFEGINNTTTANNHAYPAYYTGPDDNYATVKQGETYPLSVSISPDFGEYVYAYIDWNQNKVFDPEETYTVVEGTGAPGPFTINIPVPQDAVPGGTRMRVMVGFGSPAPDPCAASISDGETEDYRVVVEEALGTTEDKLSALSVYPNPVEDILHVTSEKEIQSVSIFNMAGQKSLSEVSLSNSQLNVSHLPAGIYILNVHYRNGKTDNVKFIKK